MPIVTAPVSGEVHPLSDVPDPVFSDGLVGGGLAIDPWGPARDEAAGPDVDGRLTVVAPVSGRIVRMFPHAFAISGEAGDVLVHLGLETVTLRGEGFEELVCGGDDVTVGEPMVIWDPAPAREQGMNDWVVVCGLGTPVDGVRLADGLAPGGRVARGEPLMTLGDATRD